jgi:tetratricopeptide (TPR) repeat protein
MMVTSLIKQKEFDQASKFLSVMTASIQPSFGFEHAYVLHRCGNNKEAMTKLR